MKLKDFVPWKHDEKSVTTPYAYERDPFVRLHQQMNRLMEGLSQFEPLGMDVFRGFGSERSSVFSPKVDVRDTPTELIVRAELPGLTEKDIDVSLTEDHLIIKGEKKCETEKKEGEVTYCETTYGSFQRLVPVHGKVNHQDIRCELKAGVLTVTVPRIPDPSKEVKKIEVKVSE
jgi:HSP20 family protein